MKYLFSFGRVVAMLAMATLIGGCAGTPPISSNDALLSAAGFKTVIASTDKQLQQLPTLPAGQVTMVSQTGKNWFVYPDVAKNRVYVGTEREYRAYLKLRAQHNLPGPNVESSYFKQDSAMTAKSARYAVPKWEGWTEFEELVWD